MLSYPIYRTPLENLKSNPLEAIKALLTTYFSTGVQRLRKVWGDGGYCGDDLKAWVAQLKQTHKIDLEVVKKKGTGFTVLPHRWVVERTFAWRLKY